MTRISQLTGKHEKHKDLRILDVSSSNFNPKSLTSVEVQQKYQYRLNPRRNSINETSNIVLERNADSGRNCRAGRN